MKPRYVWTASGPVLKAGSSDLSLWDMEIFEKALARRFCMRKLLKALKANPGLKLQEEIRQSGLLEVQAAVDAVQKKFDQLLNRPRAEIIENAKEALRRQTEIEHSAYALVDSQFRCRSPRKSPTHQGATA